MGMVNSGRKEEKGKKGKGVRPAYLRMERLIATRRNEKNGVTRRTG